MAAIAVSFACAKVNIARGIIRCLERTLRESSVELRPTRAHVDVKANC
jgi:cob(I)alamin adenosyltransferase